MIYKFCFIDYMLHNESFLSMQILQLGRYCDDVWSPLSCDYF